MTLTDLLTVVANAEPLQIETENAEVIIPASFAARKKLSRHPVLRDRQVAYVLSDEGLVDNRYRLSFTVIRLKGVEVQKVKNKTIVTIKER